MNEWIKGWERGTQTCDWN